MNNVCRLSRRGHRAGPAHQNGRLFCIHCGAPMGTIRESDDRVRWHEIAGLVVVTLLVLLAAWQIFQMQ